MLSLLLFLAKGIDNLLGTGKMLLLQKGKWVTSGILVFFADLLHFWITKHVITSDSVLAVLSVALAGALGCMAAGAASDKLSRDRLYVNIILSDDKKAMQDLRDYLAEKHIRNVCCDSYTLDWEKKSLTVTAYAETRQQSRDIEAYLLSSPGKFRRLIQKA